MKYVPIDESSVNDDLPTTRLPRIPESIDHVADPLEQAVGEPAASALDGKPVLSVDADSSVSIGFSESD